MEMNMRITMNKTNSSEFQHNKLSDLVLNKLMDWIMDGKLHMGEKLNTEELANNLGVSRMPIREALKYLEKMGLAESVPYVGTRLVSLTEEDVRQIYIARRALEPIVAYYACEKITDEEIAELEKVNREYKQIIKQEEVDAKEVYKKNRYFHFLIYGASDLDKLCAIIESLWDSLSFFKLIYGKTFIDDRAAGEKMIQEHDNYLTALKARDCQLLSRLISENLDERAEHIPYENAAYYFRQNDK